MSYQILRIEKLTEISDIKASASHNFREVNVPNADPSRTHLNKTIGAKNGNQLISLWETNIKNRKIKVRNKKTVKIVEFLITASPQFFTDKKIANDYFKSTIKWFKSKFGEQNILSVNMQLDETTPHMVAYVIPEVEGKLNAKYYFGGKPKMSALQDDFYIKVARRFSLERGLKGSKAKHQKVSKIYGVVNQPNIVLPRIPNKNIIGQYVREEVEEYVAVTQKLVTLAQKLGVKELENRELRTAKKTAEWLQKEIEKKEKISAEIAEQNHKLMLRLSKLILNFDSNTKSQIAAKLKIQPDKPLIDQLQKGSLEVLNKLY